MNVIFQFESGYFYARIIKARAEKRANEITDWILPACIFKRRIFQRRDNSSLD